MDKTLYMLLFIIIVLIIILIINSINLHYTMNYCPKLDIINDADVVFEEDVVKK